MLERTLFQDVECVSATDSFHRLVFDCFTPHSECGSPGGLKRHPVQTQRGKISALLAYLPVLTI